MSKRILTLMSFAFIFVGLSSCAPVKFSKSDSVVVDNGIQPIVCTPKINGTLTSFTYSNTGNPNVISQCVPSADISYAWTVKNSSGVVITTPISGLSGATDRKSVV